VPKRPNTPYKTKTQRVGWTVSGTNTNTLKKDDRAWDFWETVCERAGTSPMRTPQEVRENPERQAWLLAILMLYASAVCVSKTPGRAGVHQTALGAGVPLGHHPHLQPVGHADAGFQAPPGAAQRLVAHIHSVSRPQVADDRCLL
jgi:hypothetical protein